MSDETLPVSDEQSALETAAMTNALDTLAHADLETVVTLAESVAPAPVVEPTPEPTPEPVAEPVAEPDGEPVTILVGVPHYNPDPRAWRRVPEMVLNEDGWPTWTGKMLTVDEAGTLIPLM